MFGISPRVKVCVLVPSIVPGKLASEASDANWGCAAKRGETAHTQLLTEMAEHYHGFRNNDGQQVRAWVIDESSNDSLANGSGSKASVTWQTMNAGNSTPFNVMQPSLYLHHIIKI